jgi:hypothetical protein
LQRWAIPSHVKHNHVWPTFSIFRRAIWPNNEPLPDLALKTALGRIVEGLSVERVWKMAVLEAERTSSMA